MLMHAHLFKRSFLKCARVYVFSYYIRFIFGLFTICTRNIIINHDILDLQYENIRWFDKNLDMHES